MRKEDETLIAHDIARRNKLPRDRAIEVLNGVCYAIIVISVRQRRDEELNHIFSSAEAEREGGLIIWTMMWRV